MQLEASMGIHQNKPKRTPDPHDPVVFVIIAVLGVMVIIALHLI